MLLKQVGKLSTYPTQADLVVVATVAFQECHDLSTTNPKSWAYLVQLGASVGARLDALETLREDGIHGLKHAT